MSNKTYAKQDDKLKIYTIEYCINKYLDTKRHLSKRTFKRYLTAMNILGDFLYSDNDEFFENDQEDRLISELYPEFLDYFYSYHLIRKYIMPDSFLVDTAIIGKGFFKYLLENKYCEEELCKTLIGLTKYYSTELKRVLELTIILYEDDSIQSNIFSSPAEGDIEVGYVKIDKIEGDCLYGYSEDSGEYIGPVKVSKIVALKTRVGDVINMITISKSKKGYYEIIELGFVYPRSYFD